MPNTDSDKKTIWGYVSDLPGVKKISSTSFGLAIAPLVAYCFGLVPLEYLINPFGIICWVASSLVIINDAVSAYQAKKYSEVEGDTKT